MRGLILGAIAGAAGTVALDVGGYVNMVVRGRSSSDMPAEVIRRLALIAGIEQLSAPSDEADEATKNRRSALGAITGYKVGTMLGALYGLTAYPASKDHGIPLRAVVLAVLAMAASDVPATLLGATKPSEWGAGGWMSDIVPHLAYGIVTAAAFEAIAQAQG